MTSSWNEDSSSVDESWRFPRLDARVVWRPAGLGLPRYPAMNAGLGGMLVYSDEPPDVGALLELEVFLRHGTVIELQARVVRVKRLTHWGPAGYDVALEIVDVPREARGGLARGLGMAVFEDAPPVPTPRPSGERTTRRRHALFVTPYLPSPPRFGGQMRLHGLISGLAAVHDVSVLSLVDPNEDQTEAIRATGEYARLVVTVPNRRVAAAQKRRLQVRSLLSSRSYEWLLHEDDTFDAVLAHLLAKEQFDVVQFEFSHMAAYRPKRPRGADDGTPAFILDEHNIEYDVVRQMSRAAGSSVRRLYNAFNWKKVQSEERLAWAGLDGCALTSARDQGMLLADAPATRTAVVPNGVDLGHFSPREWPEPRDPQMILFFGAIDYHPNTDALLFFAKEILPLLRAQVPGVKLCIVGRRPPPAITAMQSAHIEVTGAVGDLRPYLERASVVIAPLRLGGGTRLKILEAMAMGKAVVSTTLGAEGLCLVPGRDILIADAPDRFASQVRVLLEDPALAERIGAAARCVISDSYGWQASVARLAAFHGEVIASRGAAT
jgi:sugar transferase (PEP-CTERM/EpsH1 system associated)